MRLRTLAHRAAGLVVSEILYSHVYARDLRGAPPQVAAAPASFTVDHPEGGDPSFALHDDTGLLTECRFIDGARYSDRFPWKLSAGEAVLIRLKTLPPARGRGLATALIAQASEAMRERGYRRLFAMVWFSNKPSKRAFEKAGWTLAARHMTIRLRGIRRRPIEIVRRA